MLDFLRGRLLGRSLEGAIARREGAEMVIAEYSCSVAIVTVRLSS